MMALVAKRILVPVGGSKSAEEAFSVACRLAKAIAAKVYALYVIEVGQDVPLDAEIGPESEKGEAVLERIEALAREEKCPVEGSILQARHAGPAIVQEAVDRRMELITLGVSYKRRLSGPALGVTSSYVVKNAPCPVLLWREEISPSSLPGG